MRLPTTGELRHRVRLEAEAVAGDGGGGATSSWSLVAEVWAAIRAAGGTERMSAEALGARVTHEVWIRHRADVTPAMRLLAGTQMLDIRAALDPDGRRRWLKCLCEERE